MKKFLYGLFFSLSLIILIVMLFSAPSSLYRDKAGAFSSTSSTITFDDIDYSVNLPYGSSLNDLENANIIKDSTFSSFPGGTYTADVIYDDVVLSEFWKIQINTIGASVTLTKDNGLLFYSKTDIKSYNYLSYRMPNNVNGTYFFRVSVNGVEFSSSITTNYDFNSSYQGGMSRYCDFGTYRVGYGLEHNYDNFKFIIGLSNLYEEVSFTIDYVSVSFSNLPYYSTDYVNNLLEAEGIYNNDYSWSISPVMSVSYDFNTFSPNTTLYYIKNIPVFNLTDTFPDYFSKISSTTTFTEDTLKGLKISWNSLKSSLPDRNSLQIDTSGGFFATVLDGIRALGYSARSTITLLWYICESTVYTGLVALAPIVDMFSYVSILIYTSINSWTLL